MTKYEQLKRLGEPRFESSEHGVYLAQKGWKQRKYQPGRLRSNGHTPFSSRNEIYGDFTDGTEKITLDFRKLYEAPRLGKLQHLAARVDALDIEFNKIPIFVNDGVVDYVQLRKDLGRDN